MKVLIGTPIHVSKDYAMARWLENVSQLEYPADLLLVDNSPGSDYVEKVKGYCAKFGIKNYQIEHFEIGSEQGRDERIARAREIIRQAVLAKNYDAWFSWESDHLIPTTALNQLVKLMGEGDFMMVIHNTWDREIPSESNAYFGCALIRKDPLEKYGFLLDYPNMPKNWHRTEEGFKKLVLTGGGNYIEVSGLIKPIYHLNE